MQCCACVSQQSALYVGHAVTARKDLAPTANARFVWRRVKTQIPHALQGAGFRTRGLRDMSPAR